MDKCKYCGVDGPYENCANSDDWPIIVVCYRRQLAAANERAVERANDYARVLSQIAYCHEKAYMAKDALKRHGQFGAFPPYTNDDDDEDDYGPELGGDL